MTLNDHQSRDITELFAKSCNIAVNISVLSLHVLCLYFCIVLNEKSGHIIKPVFHGTCGARQKDNGQSNPNVVLCFVGANKTVIILIAF